MTEDFENLDAVNETDKAIIGRDVMGRPIYIQKPGQTLYEAYQDAIYGPNWQARAKLNIMPPSILDLNLAGWEAELIAKRWARDNGLRIIRPRQFYDEPSKKYTTSEIITRYKDRGFTNSQIAEMMGVTEDTVVAFLEHIGSKTTDQTTPVDAARFFLEFMRKNTAYFATRKNGVSLTLLVDMYNVFCHTSDAPERVLERDGVIQFAMNYWDHSESRTYGNFVDYLFFGFRREQVS